MDAAPKARNTRYLIADPLVAFWNKFVRPNVSSITLGFGEEVYRHQVLPGLSGFMGIAFEEICREHLRRYAQEFLPAPAQEIGQVWAADFDIDAAGRLLDGTVVYGECKWSTDAVGENVLGRLIERADRTRYGAGERRRRYVVYSRSGFSAELERRASNDPSVHLRTVEDLVVGPSMSRGKP
jgi:hypothetical protein